MNLRSCIVLFACGVILSACNAAEPAESKLPKPGQLYLNYSVSSEEGAEDVVCKMVFTVGKPSGKTLALNGIGRLTLDDQILEPDSTRLGGAYYETTLQAAAFEGTHKIVFDGVDGARFTEEFQYRPFRLARELPPGLPKSPFYIELLDAPEELQLIMIDTSFESSDVNETVQVRDGRIAITGEMLARLVSGPVILELHQEDTRPLKEPTGAGGHFTLFYALKRELELAD